LFLEEKIDMFIKEYEMKKVYLDYNKYCKGEVHNEFLNKRFGLKLPSGVNKLSIIKNKTHCSYDLIKESAKNKY
jgi:hypothetical protein